MRVAARSIIAVASTLAIDSGPTDVAAARRDDRRQPAPARSPPTATARRSSPATRASAGPTPSSPSGSSGSRRGLLGLGLEVGDRVGLWSPNYAEWTLLQYATAEIGVILVNINPAYRTHELAYALNQSGCRMLFAAPSFKTSDYVEMVEQVAAERAGARAGDLLLGGRVGRARRRRRRRRPTTTLAARRGRGCAPTTRSTSSTRRARPGSPRAPRSPTATSSTTATSSPACRASPRATGCASPCPSTTASAW